MGKPAWIYADSTVKHRNGVEAMLQNDDLKVIEVEERRWGTWNYVAFWLSDAINIGTWMVISAIIGADNGLSWWEAWLCVWIGYFIVAVFICISGQTGAVYHISFPVIGRASFGIFGSLWPIFNRGVMSCVWYGVQAWIGGQCVVICIRAVIPSYQYLQNTLPSSSGTNTRDFIGFMIFWSLSNIAIWFPAQKMRHLFTVKAIVVPIAGLLFFAWVVVKAKGIGPVLQQLTISSATTKRNVRAWAWISAIMSCISGFVTIIINISDYTRFATRPSIVFWPQMISIPLAFSMTSFIGLIIGSSSKVIYGKEIWNPLELLSTFLNNMPSTATRIGVFFISLSFCLAQLGVNIAANSISAGCDLTAICPKYLNMRRSGYICSIVGLCICPWYLLSNSSSFLSYLSAYSTFVSAIAGVLFSDYYLVRCQHLETSELFSGSSDGLYYYTWGINWRAYVAYIAGILINAAGFAGEVGVQVPPAIMKMYKLNFFLGIITSGGVYYILHKLSPVKIYLNKEENLSDSEVEALNYIKPSGPIKMTQF
jgi:NCS1 family nucleobase:cation symporter-1